MKRFFFVTIVVILATLLNQSCVESNTILEKDQAIPDLDKKTMLDAFTSVIIDTDVMAEVLTMVNNSIEKGLDENLYLRELWMNEPAVKVASSKCAPILKMRLEQFFSNLPSTKSSFNQDVMAGTDWVIYWPYSEFWDGKTLPVITTVPSEKDQEWNYGYRRVFDEKGEMTLEQVYVDDDFAFNNPVWIIKQETELNYENLPNFNMGEVKSGSITYCLPVTKTAPDTAHVWTMVRAQVTKQYDTIFQGSSNLKIIISYPPYTGNSATTAEYYVDFTRSEIRQQRFKNLGLMLNSDWNYREISNGMTVVETDGGTTIPISIILEVDDDTCVPYIGPQEIELEIYIEDEDDLIMNFPYKRVYVRSYAGSSVQSFDDGGFNFFMRMNDVV